MVTEVVEIKVRKICCNEEMERRGQSTYPYWFYLCLHCGKIYVKRDD